MTDEAPAEEPWKTLAASSAPIDPAATLTAARYAAAVRGAPPPSITLPELPYLPIAQLHAGAGAAESAGADFEVTGALGEGGMGKVLLARQRSLHRNVAIKVVRAEHSSGAVLDALIAEALVTGYIEHPNVIPVHTLGRDAEGRPVLVMKRIEGVSWRELAQDPGSPVWSAIAPDTGDRLDAHLEIFMAVCNAAHFAHDRGIVHRDIKLNNVMIGSFGEVYLVDWGVALQMAQPGKAGPSPGGIVGTPAYMAPEMIWGSDASIDARTDVYLLGATLHAVLIGAPRHRGESLVDVLMSARESRPFAYGRDVPAELAAICNRAMSAAPAHRFRNALELRRAIASFRRHRGSIALGDEATARLGEAAVTGDTRRLHGLLTEARFGFMQALRDWPENPAARGGLESCLARMIDHELAQRDAAGARALLAEMRAPLPDVAARIEALEAELHTAAQHEAELRALRRDRDLSVSGGAQLMLVGLWPALGAGVLVYMVRRGDRPLSPLELLAPPGVAFVALLVGLALTRARLHTEISKKALAVVVLIPAACLLHRAAVLAQGARGAPIAALFTADLVIAAAAVGALAVTLVPRIGWVVTPFLLGVVGVTIRPDLALAITSAAIVSGLVLLLVTWRQAVRPR